ncbi:MAG: hypothetical protein FJ385_09900 [Verrucomicrobia bacterium]|nr:hypothetical protein [Verrucomicrobiota bacterium]
MPPAGYTARVGRSRPTSPTLDADVLPRICLVCHASKGVTGGPPVFFNANVPREASRRVGVPPTFILFIGSVFSTATDASDTVLGTAEMTWP